MNQPWIYMYSPSRPPLPPPSPPDPSGSSQCTMVSGRDQEYWWPRISTLLSFCLTYGNAAVLTPLGRFLCPYQRRMTLTFWLKYESLATGHKVIWAGYYTKKAFLVTQLVKNSPAMQETLVQSLGWKDPRRKHRPPMLVFLSGESQWTEEPGGLQSTGSQGVRHDWAMKQSTLYEKRKDGVMKTPNFRIILKFSLPFLSLTPSMIKLDQFCLHVISCIHL